MRLEVIHISCRNGANIPGIQRRNHRLQRTMWNARRQLPSLHSTRASFECVSIALHQPRNDTFGQWRNWGKVLTALVTLPMNWTEVLPPLGPLEANSLQRE